MRNNQSLLLCIITPRSQCKVLFGFKQVLLTLCEKDFVPLYNDIMLIGFTS